MNKIISLIQASKEDISFFNKGFTDILDSKNTSFVKKNIIMISLILLLMFLFGFISYALAEQMTITNQTYLIVILMGALSVILTLLNTIYKAKGVLFDSNDNDMLFSMPLTKTEILASKIIKIIIFQYMWHFLVLVPAIIVYIYFEGISFNFFIATLTLLLFLPLIPIVIGTLIGYVMTWVSSKFKNKNTAYVFASVIFMIATIYFVSNIGSYLEKLGIDATDVEVTLTSVYYPFRLYRDCVLELSVLKIMIFILINTLPLILLTTVLSIKYYKIISKLSENTAKSKYVLKKGNNKKSTLTSLISKELKRYLSSAVYITNTIITPIMLLGMSVYIFINGFDFSTLGIQEEQVIYLKDTIIYMYIAICLMMFGMSNITASCLSIEGRSLWIMKMLPISTKKIFIAKVLTSLIINLPFLYISTILLAIKFEASILYMLILLVIATVLLVFLASVGLIINLLNPTFNVNEIVVIKQSKSTIISLIGTIILAGLFMYIGTKLQNTISLNTYSAIFLGLIVVTIVGIWRYLLTKGKEKFIKLGE